VQLIKPRAEYSRVWFSGSGRNLDLLIYGFLIMVIAVYRPNGVMSLFELEGVRRLMAPLGIGKKRAGSWRARERVEDAA
jgi:hypothetical protein